MFAISHEVPIALLEKSRSFNDYDYALVHLFQDNPKYYEFFQESIKRGRKVILDNSAYELGEPYEIEHYKWFISNLNPTEFILPDYKDDRERTVNAARHWNHSTSLRRDMKIAVVHGKNYSDYCVCYAELEEFSDKLAFSFESFFVEYANTHNLAIDEVRAHILNRMLEEGIIDTKKRHHILGALSPTEFQKYVKYSWIESADTSNPVLHGLLGQLYTGEEGLKVKSKIKLDSLITTEVSSKMLENVMFNVTWFRQQFNLPSKINLEETDGPANNYDEVKADHYRQFPIETIDLFKSIYGTELTASWCEMTALKYRMRLGHKPTTTVDKDLQKEKWYLDKAKELRDINFIEGN